MIFPLCCNQHQVTISSYSGDDPRNPTCCQFVGDFDFPVSRFRTLFGLSLNITFAQDSEYGIRVDAAAFHLFLDVIGPDQGDRVSRLICKLAHALPSCTNSEPELADLRIIGSPHRPIILIGDAYSE